jgi:hypothetical protein
MQALYARICQGFVHIVIADITSFTLLQLYYFSLWQQKRPSQPTMKQYISPCPRPVQLVALLLALSPISHSSFASAFQIISSSTQRLVPTMTCRFATRYGPPLDDIEQSFRQGDEEERRDQQKQEFRTLLSQVIQALQSDRPEHIPSLLTKNTHLLLRMTGESVVELVQQALEGSNDDNQQTVELALEMMVSFAEDFVEESKQLDDGHKHLLGKIIRTMTDAKGTAREREELLDQFMKTHKEEFTRGFLRHVEGQIQRIASAPNLTTENYKLQETLRVIQTRILEELGHDLGEGAMVLGQLIAYEDNSERIAVLEAGLQVRGVAFAQELASLTEEALQGFKTAGNVDPTLVARVTEIDQRIKEFIEEHRSFQ